MQAFAQSINGFTKVRGHRRLTRLAGRGHTELAGVRVSICDRPENRLKNRRVQFILGRRLARLCIALEYIEPGLQGLDVQPGQAHHRLAQGAQPLAGKQVVPERRRIDGQADSMQCVLHRAQRQGPSLLGFQALFECHDSGGLVPEAHLAALFVFDKVGGQDMALRAPRPKQHHELAVARIPRLGPQLLHHEQPGVAAGLDDEVRLAGSAGYGQWRPQTASADRLLDVIELDVHRPAWVVLVGPDVVDRQLDLVFELIPGTPRIRPARKIARVVARVADLQRLRHQLAARIDGGRRVHWSTCLLRNVVFAVGNSLRAHIDRSDTCTVSAYTPRRLGISSHTSWCMTALALGMTPACRRSCRCTGMRSVAASL